MRWKKLALVCWPIAVLVVGGCEITPKKQTKITQVNFVYVGRRIVPKQFVVSTSKEVTEPGDRIVTKVTNFGSSRIITTPSISKDGRVIVFSNLSGKSWNLQSIQVGEAGVRNITRGPWLDFWPTFGPNGKEIVFCSNRATQGFKLSRVSIKGVGGIGFINAGPEGVISVDVRDDGKLVFCAPNSKDTYQIWTAEINGSLPTQLSEGKFPKWGRGESKGKILFCRKDPNTESFQIWVMDEDGGNETKLTEGEGSCIHPTWSPDGKKIAFASNRNKGEGIGYNFDIFEMESDGSNVVQLTSNVAYDAYPMYSPDGKFLYFLSSRGEAWNIWRLKL